MTRFDAAVLDVLYGGQASWGELADALDAADHGDGAALLAIADEFVGRAGRRPDDDSVEAFWAISCLDGPAFGDAERCTRSMTRHAASRRAWARSS